MLKQKSEAAKAAKLAPVIDETSESSIEEPISIPVEDTEAYFKARLDLLKERELETEHFSRP